MITNLPTQSFKPRAWLKTVEARGQVWVRMIALQINPESGELNLTSLDFIRRTDDTVRILPNRSLVSSKLSQQAFDTEIIRHTYGADEVSYLDADNKAHDMLEAIVAEKKEEEFVLPYQTAFAIAG